ncbi:hypothetical protein NST17_20290 [Caldifermentibacillus hisashii]|jgi:hypothetical protein|uniref:Uncharacterized protein n=1 Tax=Caldifermentibacillus hisashii TaxID=996558 RepID=A0ABU9K4L4_9BACI
MNIAHVLAKFHLLIESPQNEKEFLETFSKDNIVASDIKIVLPDGNVIKAKYSILKEWKKIGFEEKI